MISACRLTKDLENLINFQEKEKNEELRWTPPKDDFFKMNFDDALSTMQLKANIEIVVHISKGECLNIRAKQRSICLPLMTKSEAALLGLHTIVAMGVKKLVVEGYTDSN